MDMSTSDIGALRLSEDELAHLLAALDELRRGTHVAGDRLATPARRRRERRAKRPAAAPLRMAPAPAAAAAAAAAPTPDEATTPSTSQPLGEWLDAAGLPATLGAALNRMGVGDVVREEDAAAGPASTTPAATTPAPAATNSDYCYHF